MIRIVYDRRGHLMAGVSHPAMLAVLCDHERAAAREASTEIVTRDGSFDLPVAFRRTVWKRHPVTAIGNLLSHLERHFESVDLPQKLAAARRAHVGD